MSGEYRQEIKAQHYFENSPFFAFDTHYSNIPLFHHSMWFSEKIRVKNKIVLKGYKNSDTLNHGI